MAFLRLADQFAAAEVVPECSFAGELLRPDKRDKTPYGIAAAVRAELALHHEKYSC